MSIPSVALSALAACASTPHTTAEPIANVLREYFVATHEGQADRVRALFAAEARITGVIGASRVDWSVTEFVARVSASPTAKERGDIYAKRIVALEQHGTLAVALTEVLVRGEPMIDAITLARDHGGTWRIAAKTFVPSPPPARASPSLPFALPAELEVRREYRARRGDAAVTIVRFGSAATSDYVTLVSEADRIVAFVRVLARLDARDALPSPDVARATAMALFARIAPDLVDGIEVSWIEPHDEATVRGMKVKCRQRDGRHAWVVVGANREPITFERDVVWSDGIGRRTESWLHSLPGE